MADGAALSPPWSLKYGCDTPGDLEIMSVTQNEKNYVVVLYVLNHPQTCNGPIRVRYVPNLCSKSAPCALRLKAPKHMMCFENKNSKHFMCFEI